MTISKILASILLAFSLTSVSLTASAAGDGLKVVYHLNEGVDQASNGLRNIRNHLAEDPTAKITVVTHYKVLISCKCGVECVCSVFNDGVWFG